MPYFLSKQPQRLYFDLASVVQKVDNTIHQINLYPVDNANGFLNTYPLDSDGAIQCLNNRDLESKSVCLYLQFICAIFYERGLKLLDTTKMSYPVAHYILDSCLIMK